MKKKFRVDIVTIFPEVCKAYTTMSILGRAEKAGIVEMHSHQLRQWSKERHQHVDDRPFGGGPGMVMKVEPFHEALIALKVRTKKGIKTAQAKKTRVILTSAKGKIFTQADAKRLSAYDHIVFLCGRYEGVDERVTEHLVDEELSIGQYVLTGGELAALVMTDAIARLRAGVLGKESSLNEESWTDGITREYPQYTRPEKYLGWNVPQQLLSGHHQQIVAWRKKKSTTE